MHQDHIKPVCRQCAANALISAPSMGEGKGTGAGEQA